MYWPNSHTTGKQNHLLIFVKNNGFKLLLNMKNTNNITQWKNGSVYVTITRGITQQKHLAQSGHSTQSALYIFNTLCVFTKEPIREQEISWSVWIMVNGRLLAIFFYLYFDYVPLGWCQPWTKSKSFGRLVSRNNK